MRVTPLEPKFWRQLLQLPGLDGEIDPADQYREASWPATAERSRDEWAALVEPVDACRSPVLDFLEAVRHPHNLANRRHRAEPFPQPGCRARLRSGSLSGQSRPGASPFRERALVNTPS